jgi:2-keto-4-pentenoate hydratase/2-oxohepta-3-ene-1,7-dioic acid hydratase in catechol pathway
MKIARVLTMAETIDIGIVKENQPDVFYKISGEIFSSWSIATRPEPYRALLAPIVPRQIFALGQNYRQHADETGAKYPDIPILFIKATSSLIGPNEPIIIPAISSGQVDYEAELAIIIGKSGKNIPPEKAKEFIFGYTCANDVSEREWQMHKQNKQWARAKSFDTFCPLGPWIVTADEIAAPMALRIKTRLNGKTMQDSSTKDMIFDVYTIVSNISRSLTLHTGTVILTGTPAGVGFTRQPPVFLKPHDTVTISIEGIGELTNPVIAETI